MRIFTEKATLPYAMVLWEIYDSPPPAGVDLPRADLSEGLIAARGLTFQDDAR